MNHYKSIDHEELANLNSETHPEYGLSYGRSMLESYEKGLSLTKSKSSMKKSCLKKLDSLRTSLDFQKTEEEEPTEKEVKRFDKFGNEIINGGKNHHISFKKKLSLVTEVESYKRYNMDMTLAEKACNCNTF